jgi:16S rRNA (uracil1498-N3)-methyltransferase
MRRFFFDPDLLCDTRIDITGSEARHMASVLRMKPGEKVELYDGRGLILQAKIDCISRRSVTLRVISRHTETTSTNKLILVQALLKGKKMDFLIQKATELGVDSFIPLITRYCEKRKEVNSQHARWQRIIIEACKQCHRPVPMQLASPAPLEQLSLPAPYNLLMPWEDEQTRPLSSNLIRKDTPTLLLIGPEGGFHPDEVGYARDRGFTTVSLGPRILRAETAALAATSIVQHLLGNAAPPADNS